MLRRFIWILCGLLLVAILITLLVYAFRDCSKTGRRLFYKSDPKIYKHDYVTYRHELPNMYKSPLETNSYDHNMTTEQLEYLQNKHACHSSYVFEHSDSIYKLLYFLVFHVDQDVSIHHRQSLPTCASSLFDHDKFDVKVRKRNGNVVAFEVDPLYRKYLIRKILNKLSSNKYSDTFSVKHWLFEELGKDDKWIGLTYNKVEKMINVGVCIVATNKYKSYVSHTMESVKLHLYRNQNVIFYLFTDDSSQFEANDNTVLFDIPSYGFPEATLYRYRFMKQAIESFRQRQLSYIFYIDADYRFNERPKANLLPPQDGQLQGIFATKHLNNLTNLFNKYHHIGEVETNPRSQAFMNPHLYMEAYYCGGFNGGSREAWIEAITEMDHMIQIDESNNVMPVWHDESIFNKYCALHKPIWVFNQSFIYTEQCFLKSEENEDVCKKLTKMKPIASPLLKNHKVMRETEETKENV